MKNFLRFPSSDPILLGKMALLLLIIRIGLSLCTFQKVRRLLLCVPPASHNAHQNRRETLSRFVWAAQIVGKKLLGHNRCLPEALAIHMLYQRYAMPADLRIGVTKRPDGQLVAHAWVESEGKVVIGGDQSPVQFTPLPIIDRI